MNEPRKTVADLSNPVNPTPQHIARFWSKVDKTSSPHGCWLWIAGKKTAGYGSFTFGKLMTMAHRFSWYVCNGCIPKETPFILHSCPGGDNPACVNPAHLRPGTRLDNAVDASKRGQIRSGENHWATGRIGVADGLVRWIRQHPNFANGESNNMAKLSSKDVRSIRVRLANGCRGIGKQLAKEYGVAQARISEIKHGNAWQDVE